jgi:hypothetical protein
MTFQKTWIHPEEAVLVLGSLNVNAADRYLDRSAVRPVTAIMDGEMQPVPFFDTWGELGMSSFALHPTEASIFYASAGADFVKVDLDSGARSPFPIPKLQDIHEMTVVGNSIWLANTAHDDTVVFDISNEKETGRTSLDHYRVKIDPEEAEEEENVELEIVDKFHCNQVFQALDGEIYGLVHHVTGKQTIRKFKDKIVRKIKSHGDGGILGLTCQRSIPLNLRAPHHVRVIGGHYWIFDSGNNTINVYNPNWKLRKKILTKGFGRGADSSDRLGIFYGGISETRKRYLPLIPGSKQIPNMVQVFSIKKRKILGEIVVTGIEQVNNVYLVPRKTALAMLSL